MTSQETIELLQKLIRQPAFSGDEGLTAEFISKMLTDSGLTVKRSGNNIWTFDEIDESKPTVLLNSHHDTVKPGKDWEMDPFEGSIEAGKLTGLGSNDAGASLVCLLATFINHDSESKFNLVFAATAEEEISGSGGLRSIIDKLPSIDMAIVGEPTQMHAAVAEKGLVVVDCIAHGESGHAAREEGINAIDLALKDIQWIHNYRFAKLSKMLGPVKMTVTTIEAGEQHNVIPDRCKFTIDIRSTDMYSNDDILEVIQSNISSKVLPRSTRLQPSGLQEAHPLYKTIRQMKIAEFGSPTLSDQSLMPWPSLKMGPGDSARSHTANEYILLEEIENGIDVYTRFLMKLEEQL